MQCGLKDRFSVEKNFRNLYPQLQNKQNEIYHKNICTYCAYLLRLI